MKQSELITSPQIHININKQKVNNHPNHYQTINLQDQQQVRIQKINKKIQTYFGRVEINLQNNQLKLQFLFKQNVVNSLIDNKNVQDDEIQMINRQQYELTQPIILFINNQNMKGSLKNIFKNVYELSNYILFNINNHKKISINGQRLVLNADYINIKDDIVVQLYFNAYKKIEKQQLLRQYKKVKDTFNMMSNLDMQFLDPQLILIAGMTEDQLLDIYRSNDDNNQQSQSPQEIHHVSRQEQQRTQGFVSQIQRQNHSYQTKDYSYNSSNNHRNQHQYTQNNSEISSRYQKSGTFKQSQIPIYQRFRNLDINLPRKQKVKYAQKMLRMGYSKQEIIRFFGGGASQMEQQNNRTPDYRNPQSIKYKEIHIQVAKKQNQRHNELLKRLGQPPISQLPEYAGQILSAEKKKKQKRIKELLMKFVKQKKFKKIDEIHNQMKKHGQQISLYQLKKLIQDLKKRNIQKKEMQQRNRILKMSQQNKI